MKKYIATIITLIIMQTNTNLTAQQKPEEIARMITQYEQLLQREDNGFDTVYCAIQQQIKRQTDPAAVAVWHTCMAELLRGYYQENQWKIMDRTPVEGAVPEDPKVWDLQTMAKQIIYHFEKSLENETYLQQVPIKDYEAILNKLSEEAYRPTLYDFLAFRALDFLDEYEVELPLPIETFDVNNGKYWSENEVFANIVIQSPDEYSFPFLSLSIMQKLTQMHLKDVDKRALLDVTMRRFGYLADNSTLEESGALELEVLNKLEQTYRGQKGYEMIALSLGRFYEKRGERCDDPQRYPECRLDLVKAMEWYKKTMDADSTSVEAKQARRYNAAIKTPLLSLSMNQVITDQQNLLSIRYKSTSVDEVQIKIVPISEKEYLKQIGAHQWEKFKIQREKYKSFIYQTTVKLPDDGDYRTKTGHFLLPPLKKGTYVVLATSKKDWYKQEICSEGFIQVTNLDAVVRYNGKDMEVLVVDRITGAPVSNAQVAEEVYSDRQYERLLKTNRYVTNKEGKCVWEKKDDNHYTQMVISKGDDVFRGRDHRYYGYYADAQMQSTVTTYLFVDRSIYRPGQTVYYKGITVKNTRLEGSDVRKEVLVGDSTQIELSNANYQIIETVNKVTNEYGSFSGSFVLPATGRTGYYSIRTPHGSCSFSVEEYKRPTFEVVFDKPEKEYKLDQEVEVVGNVKAYAGYAVEGATVKYRVRRNASFPWWRCWWWAPNSPSQEIATGELESDADGNFRIHFLAQSDKENQRFDPLYCFEVSVDVVDITGETHSASTSVSISRIGLLIHANLPDEISTSSDDNFEIKATNLAGELQKVPVHYKIEELKAPAQYLQNCVKADFFLSDSVEMMKTLSHLDLKQQANPQGWEVANVVTENAFMSGDKFSIPNLENYKEGIYRMTFTAKDADGNEISEEYTVTIYQEKSKKCVAYTPVWMHNCTPNKREVGETVEVTVGTYLKNASVLCEIISNDRLVKSEWIRLNQGKTTLSYTLTEEDLGRVVFHAFVMQDNAHYSNVETVVVPYSHQKIDFDFLTFRDKTLPGSAEQYQIRLKNTLGEKVAAEMLCTMYDASLDALAPSNSLSRIINNWNKNVYNYRLASMSGALWKTFYSMGYADGWGYEKERVYPNLKFNVDMFSIMYRKPSINRKLNDAVVACVEESCAATMYESDVMEMKETAAKGVPESGKSHDESAKMPVEVQPLQVRTNFNETAFFYPHLRTDENGDVLIDFTMPESLTKWRLQGLAHNADMMSGYFEKYVQTSKKLMVVPNAPRFLREGDTMRFSAKIVNMDSVAQCGNVSLQFRSALTDAVVPMVVGASVMPFEVAPDKSQEVHFQIAVPQNVGAITYRIVATNLETPAFSDGEENTLPVLTNRMLVTESLPLYISNKGKKQFTFQKLKDQLAGGLSSSTTLQHYKLTLEFTPNPIWYAIQSMPYLMEYPYECNEQIFSRYYANSIASQIMNSHPRIKEVFNKWLSETPDAFCSNMEKNQELKQVLLEETPWLLDAQRESANKQHLALLFDLDRMAEEQKDVCKKLEKRQNGDGGWSWFADGESSLYITEHIVAGFGHLKRLGVPTDMSNSSIRKAIDYVDAKETEFYYKWMKGEKCEISNLHYLYARSFYQDVKLKMYHQEAYNYFLKNAKKLWKEQSLYGQALTALILYRNGDRTTAEMIMKHLRSVAQHSEEMGMWWKKEGYGYFWYEAPIERQALFIEAFHEILRDAESVEKMQLWLLKQKQTQNWGTTRATTEACYALMLNQTQILNEDDVQLQLGDWHYPNAETRAEAGSGYIKTSWEGDAITPEMSTIQIEKSSKGPAWGALYWQYFENLDKIEKNDDQNLSIRKALYKVEVGERGEVLVPITEQTPLKVGDKVRVRTEIRTDRDMEYVHLKDMRASAFEPTNVISQYKRQDGLYYYEATKDASTNFFIDYLPKGTYVFEYTLIATQAGCFSNGITTIQCMYAPEFSAHSAGVKVNVVE